MGAVSFIFDRLANALTGRGTTVDRRTYNTWLFEIMDPAQVEAAYRTNWLVRKIVDIPAKDMTRNWRAWQTKSGNIEDIEAEEKRLGLQPKCQRALKLARLFGGGACILGTGDPDPMQPLDVERVGKDGLRYVHVMNRWELSLGDQIRDIESPWFGEPEYFQINSSTGQQQQLHPSRVIPFIGQRPPEGGRFTQSDSWYWGDPIMLSIDEAVKDAMTASAGFAALIDEAKLDIIKIPELMQVWATDEHEEKLKTRLSIAATAKSMHRALILDGAEEWEQRQVTWNGMPEILMAYMELVAGAADIPVTRLLGQSPKGLQSTGKGEQEDYHDKVEADQGELLEPQLKRIDELLIRSALGSRPDDIYFEFNPLDEPDEKAESEIAKRDAETIKVYSDLALFEDEALQAIAKNKMIESGYWPGCEAAFEANPDVPEGEEPDPDAGKTMAQLAAEKAEALRSVGSITGDQATLLMADARPRSLYVQRELQNADELLAWAKGQGFTETLEAAELHVTVLYSRTPVDWLKMGSTWDENDKGQLVVRPGGARMVEALGDKGAIVLLFASSALSWRHEEMVRQGASHDFDEYQPHVTITYALPDGMDLEGVEPYRGRLVFGPEIFEEVNEDWQPSMGKGAGQAANHPFDDSHHWQTQPRDPGGEGGGQWVAGGGVDEGKAEPLTNEAKAQLIAANDGKSIDEIRAEATVNQAALHQLGEAVESELGIDFEPPPPGFEVKTKASLERKIRDEGYSGPHEITDVSRASFVVTSPEQAETVISQLARRGTVYDKGWKRLEQTGYLDRKVYLQHPNGGVSEIQIVPKGVQQLKFGQGHVLYEIIRRPDRPLEARKAAARKSRTIYAKVIRAEGFVMVAK